MIGHAEVIELHKGFSISPFLRRDRRQLTEEKKQLTEEKNNLSYKALGHWVEMSFIIIKKPSLDTT